MDEEKIKNGSINIIEVSSKEDISRFIEFIANSQVEFSDEEKERYENGG